MDTTKVVSVRFKYDGVVRHVDNIMLDDKNKQFVGFEVRKAGKFSQKIKRFDMTKMESLEFITIDRKRP
jgi:hypothetical protein